MKGLRITILFILIFVASLLAATTVHELVHWYFNPSSGFDEVCFLGYNGRNLAWISLFNMSNYGEDVGSIVAIIMFFVVDFPLIWLLIVRDMPYSNIILIFQKLHQFNRRIWK